MRKHRGWPVVEEGEPTQWEPTQREAEQAQRRVKYDRMYQYAVRDLELTMLLTNLNEGENTMRPEICNYKETLKLRYDLTSTGLKDILDIHQREEDRRIGRYRHPDTGILLYPNKDFNDFVTAIDEETGRVRAFSRESIETLLKYSPVTSEKTVKAAHWYFTVISPEKKPWEDAKPGETWEFTDYCERKIFTYVGTTGTFHRIDFPGTTLLKDLIKKGRKISD